MVEYDRIKHLEVGCLSGFLKIFNFGHIHLLMFVIVIHFRLCSNS